MESKTETNIGNEENGIGKYVSEVMPMEEGDVAYAEKSLRQLCREYAFVPFRKEPYDTKLDELMKKIVGSYEVFCKNEKDNEEIVKYRKALEETVKEEKRLLGKIKGWFSRNGDNEDLGEMLLKQEKGLEEMRKVVQEAYNHRLNGLHGFASSMQTVYGLIEIYDREKEEAGKNVMHYSQFEINAEKRKEHLDELLKKKEEEEQRKLGDEERIGLIGFLISRGRTMLEQASKEYLQLEHDIDICNELVEKYDYVLKRYHEVVDSFDVIRNDFFKSTVHLQRNLALYALVTRKELELLKEVYIPEKFVEAVNFLAGEMEEIDKRFSQKALEILVREKPHVKEAVMSLEHEVVKKLGEDNIVDLDKIGEDIGDLNEKSEGENR